MALISSPLPLGLTAAEEALAPRARRDCLPGGKNCERPCPWVRCRHHCWTEVTPKGTIRDMHRVDPEDLATPSCSLDIAATGPQKFAVIGRILGITKQRAAQVEKAIMPRLPEDVRRFLWYTAAEWRTSGLSSPVD